MKRRSFKRESRMNKEEIKQVAGMLLGVVMVDFAHNPKCEGVTIGYWAKRVISVGLLAPGPVKEWMLKCRPPAEIDYDGFAAILEAIGIGFETKPDYIAGDGVMRVIESTQIFAAADDLLGADAREAFNQISKIFNMGAKYPTPN